MWEEALEWTGVSIQCFCHSHKYHCLPCSLSNRPYLLYFDLSKCTGPQVLFQGCRSPSVHTLQPTNSDLYETIQKVLIDFFLWLQVCVEKCPSSVWTDQISGTTDVSNLICMDGINKTQMVSTSLESLTMVLEGGT